MYRLPKMFAKCSNITALKVYIGSYQDGGRSQIKQFLIDLVVFVPYKSFRSAIKILFCSYRCLRVWQPSICYQCQHKSIYWTIQLWYNSFIQLFLWIHITRKQPIKLQFEHQTVGWKYSFLSKRSIYFHFEFVGTSVQTLLLCRVPACNSNQPLLLLR